MPNKDAFKKAAAITAIGGAVGFLATLVKNDRHNLKDPPEDRLKLLYSELSELILAAIYDAKQLDERQRKRFKQAFSAAELSKAKLENVIEALKDHGSQDHDLDIAIKEAERAIRHARTFLLKK